MIYRLVCAFIIISLSTFMPFLASANETSSRNPNFFDTPDTCNGLFCYKDFKEPDSLQNNKDSQASIFTGTIDWEKVWTIPPEELKTLINETLSWAQQAPDDENRMLTYLSLQGVAMRRAKTFQEAWSAAILKYPILDEVVQRSPTTAATNLEIIAEREDRRKAISQMRDQMGLIFFFSPACAYCEKEKAIISSFIDKWDWKNLTAINIHEHPDLAAEYGVQVVPDIWVVGNTDQGIRQTRLKAGLAEHADIERGLLSAWNQWFGKNAYERPEMVENLVPFKEFLKSSKAGR